MWVLAIQPGAFSGAKYKPMKSTLFSFYILFAEGPRRVDRLLQITKDSDHIPWGFSPRFRLEEEQKSWVDLSVNRNPTWNGFCSLTQQFTNCAKWTKFFLLLLHFVLFVLFFEFLSCNRENMHCSSKIIIRCPRYPLCDARCTTTSLVSVITNLSSPLITYKDTMERCLTRIMWRPPTTLAE